MRPNPLTVLRGGINRLRVKGGARADMLYDLLNAYITTAGSVQIREGTARAATLSSATVGLAAMNGQFNVFANTLQTVPAGYVCNVLVHPTNPALTPSIIWFAKPFMGFLYITCQFSDGSVFDYWLQNNGTWAADTVYITGNIVLPPTPTGLAYLAVRDMPPNPNWSSETIIALGNVIEPTTYTGFAYRAVAVAGTSVHTGQTEPNWPTTIGGIIQEFGDFDTSTTDAGTTQGTTPTSTAPVPLGGTITDRYGDSSTIAGVNAGTQTSLTTTASASTKVSTWKKGTLYAPGAVVQPTTSQGAFINAIPNGDFEAGDDGNWVKSAGDVTIQTTNPYQGTYCVQFALNHDTQFATMNNFGVVVPGQSVTASVYLNPNNNGANTTMWVNIQWYNSSDVFLSQNQSAGQQGFGYRKTSVTAVAPTGAAHCRVQIESSTGTNPNPSYADLAVWSLETAAAVSNFLFEAIQSSAATSGSTEPTWPTALGNTVVDGGVTWQAIGTSIITWQAIPIMLSGGSGIIATFGVITGGTLYTTGTYNSVPLTGGSGVGAKANITVAGGAVTAVVLAGGGSGYRVGDVLSVNNTFVGGTGSGFSIPVATITGSGSAPAFTTTVGTSVADPSTYTTLDGHSTNTSMSWQAINRQITDPNDPNTIQTCLGASHVFKGNTDICSYSAAVDPTDYTSTNNAGYLPTGLNNYGDNPIAVLTLYRSNLVAMNAGGYQMWQIDPDPGNMALLDAQPVGSIYTRAAQSVANDLLFLTEVGVRNLGTVGATANMQIGATGQPVDPIVKAQINAETYTPISLYYPGRGQYWLFFGPQAFVLTINGAGVKTWSRYVFPDVITDWTLNEGILFLRSAGNLVWSLSDAVLVDDAGASFTASITANVMTVSAMGAGSPPLAAGMTIAAAGVTGGTTIIAQTGGTTGGIGTYTVTATGNVGSEAFTTNGLNVGFNGVMQWPYLDVGVLGINKMFVGLDLIGTGQVTIQIGYREDDPTTFSDNAGFNTSQNVTAPYTISAADTVPGTPIPIPIDAPSYSIILTWAANQAWSWQAANLYLQDNGGGGSTG